MISVSESLKTLLKSSSYISTSAGALIEYNLNTMVEYIKAESSGTDHALSKAFKKLFPIDTIYKPFRPLEPGIKYLIYTSGNTDTGLDTYQSTRTVGMSDKPRLYYPGPDTYYKYWVGPKNSNINISLSYFANEEKTTPKIIVTNKIVARFETGHDTPTSWTIKATKEDGSEVTLGTGTALNSKGEAVVYYNGTSWSNTWNSTIGDYLEPESFSNTQSFKKVSLEAVNSNTGKFLAVTELSPRWIIDVTQDVVSFEVNKETDQEGFLPVGTITSNYLSISLNKFKQNEKNIVEYNRSSSIDSSKLYLFKNAVIKPYINIKNLQQDNKIYQGVFYMHSWQISEFGQAEVSALDSAKILQETLCPEVLVENGSISLVIKRILDSIGFSNYYINVKTDSDGNVIDNSLPSLSYWWTTSEETVWEALQNICKDFQINAFVNESNILNFYSRDYIYDSARTTSWEFTSETVVRDGITILPNIISYNSQEQSSANEVRIRYSVPSVYQGNNSAQPLWESDTYMLGAGALSKDLELTDEYFNLETTTFDTTQTNQLLGGFNGYVLLNNEVIEYDGIEYQYVPLNSSTNTPQTVVIKSDSDIAKYANLSKKNTLTEQYFTATGRYKIKTRGALSTESAKRVHQKSPSSYINTTPGSDPSKFNLYKMDITTSQDKDYKPGSGSFKAPINPMTQAVSKAFLSLSNLDQDKRTFDVAVREFNSIDNTKNYFAFGTRMFFDSQFESPEQAGGLAIFTDPQGKYGYYLILRSTAFAGLKKDLMLVKQWKVGNKTNIKVLKDSQDNTFSTLAGIYAGTAYNIDVVIKREVGKNTINVFVNGFKMIAQDVMFESGNDQVNPVVPTKNIGVHCGQGVTYFEYIYGKDITEEEYNMLSVKSGLDYIGVYSDDSLSLLHGDLVYAAGETVDSRKGALIEFGSTAREIRKVKTVYSDRPAIPNYVRTGNNKYANVLAQRIQPFSFEAYVLNNTSTSIPLHDGEFASFYVNGSRVSKSSPIEYDTKSDTDSNNIEPLILDTSWIQSESDAKNLAEWIKSNTLNKGRSIEMEVFGNPLLSPGDIISINYPLQGIGSDTKYIITKVTTRFEEGVFTSVSCRAI
jgi:hypothetical protein